MTDNLLQALEERMMGLVAELEKLRQELQEYKRANTALKAEQFHHTQKLQSLIELLDTIEPDPMSAMVQNLQSLHSTEEIAHA